MIVKNIIVFSFSIPGQFGRNVQPRQRLVSELSGSHDYTKLLDGHCEAYKIIISIVF